ncbi:uncharacterized protein LOC111638701 [Centruroides sculpturatus]|uniref:uncharacterized protein LOC111638701 n=1 Tax=Centruroides sculpturatus TaxID=218467 RepID=UPI000C6E09D8|nr:uncharacterized protein LOC111638701 [Centruroides sculpturatus]
MIDLTAKLVEALSKLYNSIPKLENKRDIDEHIFNDFRNEMDSVILNHPAKVGETYYYALKRMYCLHNRNIYVPRSLMLHCSLKMRKDEIQQLVTLPKKYKLVVPRKMEIIYALQHKMAIGNNLLKRRALTELYENSHFLYLSDRKKMKVILTLVMIDNMELLLRGQLSNMEHETVFKQLDDHFFKLVLLDFALKFDAFKAEFKYFTFFPSVSQDYNVRQFVETSILFNQFKIVADEEIIDKIKFSIIFKIHDIEKTFKPLRDKDKNEVYNKLIKTIGKLLKMIHGLDVKELNDVIYSFDCYDPNYVYRQCKSELRASSFLNDCKLLKNCKLVVSEGVYRSMALRRNANKELITYSIPSYHTHVARNSINLLLISNMEFIKTALPWTRLRKHGVFKFLEDNLFKMVLIDFAKAYDVRSKIIPLTYGNVIIEMLGVDFIGLNAFFLGAYCSIRRLHRLKIKIECFELLKIWIFLREDKRKRFIRIRRQYEKELIEFSPKNKLRIQEVLNELSFTVDRYTEKFRELCKHLHCYDIRDLHKDSHRVSKNPNEKKL